MKSKISFSLLLLALLGLACWETVEAKGLVRGAHPAKILRTTHLRQLQMEDKNKEEENDDKQEEEEETDAPKEEDEDEKEEDEKEEDEKEEDEKDEDKNNDKEEETEEPTEEDPTEVPTGEGTEPEEVVTEEEVTEETPEETDLIDDTQEEEMPVDDPVDETVVEETSEPVELPTLTDAPTDTTETAAPTDTTEPVDNETATPNIMNQKYMVNLAPFAIEVYYEGNITEDPGMEEYLYNEMLRSGGASYQNLVNVALTFAVATDDAEMRRRLESQFLFYTGTATYKGLPVHEAQDVHTLQGLVLSDKEAVSSAIATSLGEDPSNVAVTNIVVKDTAAVQDDSSSTQPPEEEEQQLSTYGLVVVIVAACIGAIALTVICLVGIKGGPSKDITEPKYTASRSVPPEDKGAAKEDADKAKEGGDDEVADLNKTFDTEEGLALNKTFDTEASPVYMKASVGRGSFRETPSNSQHGEGDDEGENPDELKEELAQQLTDLQASVKAAREKTQKLLDENKAEMQPKE